MWSVSSEKTPRVRVLPRTDLGRWALWLAGGSVVALFAAPLFGLIPWVRVVAVPLLFGAAFVAAIAGGVLALIAIIRDKERTIGVFAATIPMLFYAVFTVIEVLVGGEH